MLFKYFLESSHLRIHRGKSSVIFSSAFVLCQSKAMAIFLQSWLIVQTKFLQENPHWSLWFFYYQDNREYPHMIGLKKLSSWLTYIECIQHPISVSWITSMNLKREGGVAVSLNPSVVPDCGVVSAHLCCMMEKCFQKIKERTAESRLKAVVCFNISDVRPLILFEKRLFTAQLQSCRLCLVGPAPVWSQCY